MINVFFNVQEIKVWSRMREVCRGSVSQNQDKWVAYGAYIINSLFRYITPSFVHGNGAQRLHDRAKDNKLIIND
jgi:hypothetical protein